MISSMLCGPGIHPRWDVALPLEVLGVDGRRGREDPAVPQKCTAPGPMDVIGLPGKLPSLASGLSPMMCCLCSTGVDWLPAHWRGEDGCRRETSVPVRPPPSMAFPPLCPSFGSGPFPLSLHPPQPTIFRILSATSPCSFLTFLPRAFLALLFNLDLLICSVKSPGLSGQGQLSGSLRPSPCKFSPFFRCSMSVFSFKLDCLSLVYATAPSEALHGCQGHRGQ